MFRASQIAVRAKLRLQLHVDLPITGKGVTGKHQLNTLRAKAQWTR
jgi:hypothetical protein